MPLTGILTAIGLATPAGLNAYLALLIVGLAARFTDLIRLEAPYDLLSNTWVLVTIGVLLSVEVFADKLPGIDSINDLVGTVVRPAAGAILALASTREVGLDPVLATILGLLFAGSAHGVKATARPVLTTVTGGLANPVVSMIEDVVAAGAVVLTLLAPLVGALLVLLLLVILVLIWRWLRTRLARAGRRPDPAGLKRR